MIEAQIDAEMELRYGWFQGEHPDRAKIRLILETEPMARWLARAEIRKDIANNKPAMPGVGTIEKTESA